jgi:DNA-binding transcriptional ArsR family regulator
LIINGIVDDLLDTTLSALAEPTRRRVVELLYDGPARATDIAAHLGMTPAATSRHLRVLRTAGLVEADTPDDDTRVRLYRLRPEQLVGLGAWLDQMQAYWTAQLGAFKAHAERTRGSRGSRGAKR